MKKRNESSGILLLLMVLIILPLYLFVVLIKSLIRLNSKKNKNTIKKEDNEILMDDVIDIEELFED